MTVEELKIQLDNYFDDMEVFITDEVVGGKIGIEFVSDDYVQHSEDPLDHTHYVTIVTNAHQST